MSIGVFGSPFTLTISLNARIKQAINKSIFKRGVLDLTRCFLVDRHMEVIGEALKRFPCVSQLKLKRNHITDRGADALLEAMEWQEQFVIRGLHDLQDMNEQDASHVKEEINEEMELQETHKLEEKTNNESQSQDNSIEWWSPRQASDGDNSRLEKIEENEAENPNHEENPQNSTVKEPAIHAFTKVTLGFHHVMCPKCKSMIKFQRTNAQDEDRCFGLQWKAKCDIDGNYLFILNNIQINTL